MKAQERNIMRRIYGLCILLLGLTLIGGCVPAATEGSAYAEGAFPPTLSDEEYHQKDWTRDDCLVCHKSGQLGAPAVEHLGMPALQKDAKCRTCHVLIPGSVAEKK